jgi:hypothetical protein
LFLRLTPCELTRLENHFVLQLIVLPLGLPMQSTVVLAVPQFDELVALSLVLPPVALPVVLPVPASGVVRPDFD